MGYRWFQFTDGQLEEVLRKHDFYIRHIKAKVLSPLRDIEKLTKHELAIWEDENKYRYDDSDILGEMQGEFYEGFAVLKRQMHLNSVASMYFEWNKQVLTWLDKQLPRLLAKKYAALNESDVSKAVANLSFSRMSSVLSLIEVPIASTQTILELERMHLIVNTYKHGHGDSFEKLLDKYPEHFAPVISRLNTVSINVKAELCSVGAASFLSRFPLKVTACDIDSFASTITCFWKSMPMGSWGATIDIRTVGQIFSELNFPKALKKKI